MQQRFRSSLVSAGPAGLLSAGLLSAALLFVQASACGGGGGGGGGNTGGGAGDGGTGGGPGAAPTAEDVRQGLLGVLAQDPRLAKQAALEPKEYDALSGKLAAVSGVEASDYTGDTLGTIQVKVKGGGVLWYRHVTNDLAEAATLPPEADFHNQRHPTWNKDWKDEVAPTPIRAPPGGEAADTLANKYATHFPVASAKPDYAYSEDNAVACPAEGKIAIVDFLWTAAHRDFPGLYENQYKVDGVMLYDRLQRMGAAAGFKVDLYKDTDINLGNFNLLQDYAVVFTNGHGGRPGVLTTKRLGVAVPVLVTPEIYEPQKLTSFGMTYEDAWKKGYISYAVGDKAILWTPLLFKDHYKPSVPQLVMLNECWSMLPFNVGLELHDGKASWSQGVTSPLYNFGDALMDAGAKAVFGYVSPATPEAVVMNSMPFFRRMFGGYSDRDRPPAPHDYWPTCMGTQTYFRLPNTPRLAIYGNKYAGRSMYTMYAGADNLLLRKSCPGPIPHAAMQDFMLKVGTPATAFQKCWDQYWSHGDPVGLKDPLCNQGDKPTTLELTTAAACGVKIARKVTNAMLTSP